MVAVRVNGGVLVLVGVTLGVACDVPVIVTVGVAVFVPVELGVFV